MEYWPQEGQASWNLPGESRTIVLRRADALACYLYIARTIVALNPCGLIYRANANAECPNASGSVTTMDENPNTISIGKSAQRISHLTLYFRGTIGKKEVVYSISSPLPIYTTEFLTEARATLGSVKISKPKRSPASDKPAGTPRNNRLPIFEPSWLMVLVCQRSRVRLARCSRVAGGDRDGRAVRRT